MILSFAATNNSDFNHIICYVIIRITNLFNMNEDSDEGKECKQEEMIG